VLVDYRVHQLKFHCKLAHVRLLGVLFAEQVSSTSRVLHDCIVSVTLPAKWLCDRGFNESLELARHVGRHLWLSADYRVAGHIRHTDPKMALLAKLR
jgi:predicted amidophosphoribosyltransferase